MKIIFLDFDGVICNPRHLIAMGDRSSSLIDPAAGGLVKKLALTTGAKIVVSSTWRYGRSRDWIGDVLSAVVPEFGQLLFSHEHYWKTPDVYTNRQLEIRKWIDWYESAHDEMLEAYVILDDDRLHPPGYDKDEDLYTHYVKTDQYDGMGWTNYMNAEAILCNRPHLPVEEDEDAPLIPNIF